MSSEVGAIRFEPSEQPKASIIVLGWKSAPCLLDCLASIKRNVHHVAYEVVVTLNAPTPSLVRQIEAQVSGHVLVTSRANRGFSGGCNLGATHARGEYIVLLNDDAQVDPQWLESLVAAAERYPDAGAVGSRVLDPDGSLQAAGAILWSDGTATPVGGAVVPADVRVLGELRRVDYCGGEALLVRRSSWDAVHGLSDDYFPAYYEDVDLCLKLAAEGSTVLFEPKATVRHARGASTIPLYRAFLSRRNRDRFVEQWSEFLMLRDPPDYTNPSAVLDAIHRAAGASGAEADRFKATAADQAALRSSKTRQLRWRPSEAGPVADDSEWLEKEREVGEHYARELEGSIEHLGLQIGVRDGLIVAQQRELALVRSRVDAIVEDLSSD